MLDRIALQVEQEDLLAVLVEASRNVPKERRQTFLVLEPVSGVQAFVLHPGLPHRELRTYVGDIEALAGEDLVTMARDGRDGDVLVDVTPRGYSYYKEMKLRSDDPFQEIESTIMSYVNAEPFRSRYPEAYEKWKQASDRLWSSDSERELTVIGHLCREAMQAFATALVERFQPPEVNQNIQHTVARIRAVLDQHQSSIGQTNRSSLDAMLAHWGTANDLVQRQEHGAQREGEALVWEDGRAVVFRAAYIMFEIDHSLMFLGE